MPDGQSAAGRRRALLWVALGRQRVGKTTVLNSLVQYFRALGCDFEVWNADQQNRSHSLSTFFPGALVPPSGGMVDAKLWLEERLRDQVQRQSDAVLDPGGGWTGFASLADELPLVGALGAQGVQVVGLFCIGAERADLDYLEHYAEAELFLPDATLIICNAGLVLSGRSAAAAFAPVCEHPVVRAAVGRGAKMVILPALGCMSQVTDAGLTFDEAADGQALSFLDRARVNRWWRIEMPEFFRSVPSEWLPAVPGAEAPAGSAGS